MTNRIKATHLGVLNLGDRKLDCYVLEDGRRVLSGRGMIRALGGGRDRGDFSNYLAKIPNASEDLRSVANIDFVSTSGAVAHGYEAKTLIDVCKAYKAARRAGLLKKNQEHLANAAEDIIDALAGVGLDALIDEATGYQPQQGERLRRFHEFLRDDKAKWERILPPSLQRELCRLYGYGDDRLRPPAFMKGMFGQLWELIFGKEEAGEIRAHRRELDARTNVQVLTDVAVEFSKAELQIIELIAKQSQTSNEFWMRLRAHFLGEAFQQSFWPTGEEAPDKRPRARALCSSPHSSILNPCSSARSTSGASTRSSSHRPPPCPPLLRSPCRCTRGRRGRRGSRSAVADTERAPTQRPRCACGASGHLRSARGRGGCPSRVGLGCRSRRRRRGRIRRGGGGNDTDRRLRSAPSGGTVPSDRRPGV